ncbi:PEGA domain-containing protein, partial [Myxococcota bacterium]|nr:PEGA domain-containing protein [Myxococcota bacterium]
GRGGGSVGQRPPIAAPSRALDDDAQSGSADIDVDDAGEPEDDGPGREDLIEEGVIERRVARAPSGGFSDDKTALATDDPPRAPARLPEVEPVRDAELDEPVLEGQRRTHAFDDSKTEFAGEHRAPEPAAPSVSMPSIDDDDLPEADAILESDGEPDREADADAEALAEREPTWAPGRSDELRRDLEAAQAAQARANSLIATGDLEDVSLDAEPLADDDGDVSAAPRRQPWEEDRTVGYPGGEVPAIGDDDVGADALAEGKTGEMVSLGGRPERTAEAPLSRLARARSSAASGEASGRPVARRASGLGWEGLSEGGFELDPAAASPETWDDKTATNNDAYQPDDSMPSPVVSAVADDPGDATIAGQAVSDELFGDDPDDLLPDVSQEATLGGISFGGDTSNDVFHARARGVADPTLDPDDVDALVGAHSSADDANVDATIAGGAAIDPTIAGAPAIDESGDVPAFGLIEESTSPALDEESELPVPRSNRDVDADSRTVAGVVSDYEYAGVKVPDGGAYDPEEGFELDLDGGEQAVEIPKPKPKRGGQGLGAIKLAKKPVEVEDDDPPARFDSSEEMTEAGAAVEREALAMPRAHDFDFDGSSSLASEVDDVPSVGDMEPTEGFSAAALRKAQTHDTPPPAPRFESLPRSEPASRSTSLPKSAPKPSISVQIPKAPAFDPFADFELEEQPKPPSPAPQPQRPPQIAAKIPAMMQAPPIPSGPMGIGSTNVPAASVSLSQVLATPNLATGPKPMFQPGPRGASMAGPAGVVAAARSRSQSVLKREIRETVRTGTGAEAPMDPLRGVPGVDPLVPAVDPMAPHGGSFGDFGLAPPPPAPRRTTQRILVVAGIVLALLALAGVGYLLVPHLFPGDPRLTIRTTPEGAEIYLNGQLQPTKTPATLGGLQPGVTYELKLSLDGHETVSKAVPIPKNASTRNILVQIPLKPTPKAGP